MIQGPPNKPIPLQLTVGPGYEDRFVRAYVWDKDKTLIDVIDMDHVAFGYYCGSLTHPTEEYLTITFVVYKDSGYTVIDCIERTSKIYRILSDCIEYINRMTTVMNTETCEHEILVWLDCNGQRVTGSEEAVIEIKDSVGTLAYSDSLTTPNSDGVFRFVNTFKPGIDKNYYAVITTTYDGESYTSHQSFFTLG